MTVSISERKSPTSCLRIAQSDSQATSKDLAASTEGGGADKERGREDEGRKEGREGGESAAKLLNLVVVDKDRQSGKKKMAGRKRVLEVGGVQTPPPPLPPTNPLQTNGILALSRMIREGYKLLPLIGPDRSEPRPFPPATKRHNALTQTHTQTSARIKRAHLHPLSRRAFTAPWHRDKGAFER